MVLATNNSIVTYTSFCFIQRRNIQLNYGELKCQYQRKWQFDSTFLQKLQDHASTQGVSQSKSKEDKKSATSNSNC